jgi:hypothetical protein
MTKSLWNALFTLFLSFATMATSQTVPMPAEPMFAGTYKMAQVFDDNMAAINMPAGDFVLSLKPAKDFSSSGTYDLNVKLGNRLGGRMTVSAPTESDGLSAGKRKIKIGPVRSTMMMPEESIFRLEVSMTDILPDMTTVELVTNADDTTSMVFEGTKGKLVCEKLN